MDTDAQQLAERVIAHFPFTVKDVYPLALLVKDEQRLRALLDAALRIQTVGGSALDALHAFQRALVS